MTRSVVASFGAGLLAAFLLLGAVRFAVAGNDPDDVHYHANWALVLEGARVDFTAERYMEDVEACVADGHRLDPRARVHLHNNDMDVVHVHHRGVTWGHLLANLGWGLGRDWLATDDGRVLRDGDGGRLVLVVDGFVVDRLDDRIIDPGARALIYWGGADPDRVLSDLYPTVASNASEHDMMEDPGGCGGVEEIAFGERLRRAFLF